MSSLRDGLGQEELLSSGLSISGTDVVYVSPYFLGSVTSESNISGVNIYGTTLIKGATVAGTNLSGTTAIRGGDVYGVVISGTTSVRGTTVFASTVSGGTIRVNDEGLLHSVSIGSNTAVYGAVIQAGSGTLSAGSDYWVTYPRAYAGKPSVHVTNTTSANKAIAVITGSLTIGSAYITGEAAADTFSWISVGI